MTLLEGGGGYWTVSPNITRGRGQPKCRVSFFEKKKYFVVFALKTAFKNCIFNNYHVKQRGGGGYRAMAPNDTRGKGV